MTSNSAEDEKSSRIVEGRYRILKELGRGGYGRVYVAEDMLRDKLVAMKRLSGFGNMFTALAEVTSLVSLPPHPHICPYQGTLTMDGSPVIVTPYAANGTLADAIPRLKDSQAAIVDLALQAAYGLRQIHVFDLTHGDIKPQNLLLFEEARLAVGDFGLAVRKPQEYLGLTGGTAAYLPFDEGTSVDLRGVDWFSWALTFIEVSIGQRPWQRGNEAIAYLGRAGALGNSAEASLPRMLARLVVASPSRREAVGHELIEELKSMYQTISRDSPPAEPPVVLRPLESSISTPGFQRIDLAGGVFGPEVLLVRIMDVGFKENLDVGPLRSIALETESSANATAYLASSIVAYGRIVDVLADVESSACQVLLADSWSEMGLAYAYLGDPLGAIWAQRQALEVLGGLLKNAADEKLDEKIVGISLRLAEAYSSIGEFEKSSIVAKNVMKRARDFDATFQVVSAYANAQFEMARYDESYRVYSDLLLKLDPRKHGYYLARVYHERGYCLSLLRRPLEAELELRQSLQFLNNVKQEAAKTRLTVEALSIKDEENPLSATCRRMLPQTLKLLANALADSGKHGEAVRTYDLAINGYNDASDLMVVQEHEDCLASVELSKSFSLAELKEDRASKSALLQSIVRRRALLESGYDASAAGLANGLVALTERHLMEGENWAARADVQECLRISRTLAERGSQYHVRDIAFRCLLLFLDHGFEVENRELREQVIRMAIGELDAMDEISNATANSTGRSGQRAALLYNLATHVTHVQSKLALLDAGAELLAGRVRDGRDSFLACEIWLKRAAIMQQDGDHAGAFKVIAKAIHMSKESVRLGRGISQVESARDQLQLANLLMAGAVAMASVEGVMPLDGLSSPAECATESLSVLRSINPEDLPAHECVSAAGSLAVASNFLPPDAPRDAADGMSAFRMSVSALVGRPTEETLQAVSTFAQLATARLLDSDDMVGSLEVFQVVQSLPEVVVLPDTIRGPGRALLAELISFLTERNARSGN